MLGCLWIFRCYRSMFRTRVLGAEMDKEAPISEHKDLQMPRSKSMSSSLNLQLLVTMMLKVSFLSDTKSF
jgi:hypothetical protein